MPASVGPVTALTKARLAEAIAMSRQSPRGRIICPFHPTAIDPLHRMLNVLQPHSYVQPHRHQTPPKAESIIVLKGSLGCVIFDEAGAIEQAAVLGADRPAFGIDLHAGVFHTIFALEEDTAVFEVKQGPYERISDKDFAPWAPREGSPEAAAYLARLVRRCTDESSPR